ncbi:porin [Duganella sp. FT135W]|uniref:Porin n=1 Tax=Duganella flavida TaxID=2692175 RepID=A0A6L8KJ65_9BURK|nr:porin [Duganella flavida]MYM26258.1 porin [Duganella flavida]
MKKLIALSFASACSAFAQAETDGLTVSGFGTIGAARSDTNEARFVRSNQAEGVADTAKFGLDSNLGLQVDYEFNDTWSATTQVLTRKATSPSFTTDLTWAFVQVKINDELNVRVGRMGLPTFLISDYQNVGYANTLMRPPIEMYVQAPIESGDGVDFNYQHAFDNWNLSAQGLAGVSRGKLFLPGTAATATYRAPTMALALGAEMGPVTLRLSHLQARMTSNDIGPINNLVSSLTTAGFGQLGKDMSILSGKRLTFTAVGLTGKWHNIVVQGEYGRRRAKDPAYVPDTNAWYAMFGYRMGEVLLYYSHAEYKGAGSSVTLPASFPTSGSLSTAVRSVLTSSAQNSDALGVRWDFARSVALKVQVDRVKPTAKSGSLIYGPATGLKNSVTVVGVTLDFVF